MPGRAYGFTLVELLVGITPSSRILLGLGAPALGNYLQNSKLASAAASYFNGVQMARNGGDPPKPEDRVHPDGHAGPRASDPANTAVLSSSGKTGSFVPPRERATRWSKRKPGPKARAAPLLRRLRSRQRPPRSRSTDSAQRPMASATPSTSRTRPPAPARRGHDSLPPDHRVAWRPGRRVRSCRIGGPGRQWYTAHSFQRAARMQRGFFLIEAMVAILIFALGIPRPRRDGRNGGKSSAVGCAVPHGGRAAWPMRSLRRSPPTGSIAPTKRPRRIRSPGECSSAASAPTTIPPPCSFAGAALTDRVGACGLLAPAARRQSDRRDPG